MASKKETRKQLKKEFEVARAEYAALQKRWEKGQAKTEKRAAKLRKLAVEIAHLESRLHNQHSEPGGPTKDKDDSLRHARMIFKPTDGSTDGGAAQLKDIEERLRAHGIVAESVLKTSGKQVRAIAKEAAGSKAELLIVAAGDGTIEDAAVQLIGSKTTLGIVPIGTMNNLARALGIPLEVEDACALLGMGLTREIDAGQVQTNAAAPVEYFLESAGVGLSAIAIPAGQAVEKHRWDLLPNALRKLFTTEPSNLSVELDDGRVIDVKSEVVTVSNSPLLGDNILIAPDAKMDDGLLDIATYVGMGKSDLLGYFMSASKGKRAQDPRVVFHSARRVRISSSQPVDANSDKDAIAGGQVLDIKIVPKALRVVAGKGVALTEPIDDVPSEPPLSGPQAKPDDKPKEKEEDKDQPISSS
jgi:YegS/Rv2252/BmrU family lipid kinase